MKEPIFIHLGGHGVQGFFDAFLALSKPGRPIFLVAGRQSYEACGAEASLRGLLGERACARFFDFEPNPQIGDLQRALMAYRESGAELIIAVGGGSALDIAKLVNFFTAKAVDPADYLLGNRGISGTPFRPLLAAPTTAGTGSEATHFAVLYDGFQKYSLGEPSLVPSHVWLNPDFIASLPAYQAACSGFDALAQSMESFWAVGSTEASCKDSVKAMELCLRHLEGLVTAPSPGHRAGMLEAAYLAGRAINVSKTTAAHAMSYAFTAHYGLPHGHAVAMTLPALIEANAGVEDHDLNDPRGVAHVRGQVQAVCTLLGAATPTEAAHRLRQLMGRIGLSDAWFTQNGFRPEEARAYVLQEVNAERLGNNPRKLERAQLESMLALVR